MEHAVQCRRAAQGCWLCRPLLQRAGDVVCFQREVAAKKNDI